MKGSEKEEGKFPIEIKDQSYRPAPIVDDRNVQRLLFSSRYQLRAIEIFVRSPSINFPSRQVI